MQYTFINEYSLPYDFHNDIFFSLFYCNGILHNAYGISFFHLISFLLEYNCFAMLCYWKFLLYNIMNQPYIYTYITFLLSLPSILPFHLSRSPQSRKLSSLCYTATSSNLQAILHMIMYRLFILLVRLQGEHYALSS